MQCAAHSLGRQRLQTDRTAAASEELLTNQTQDDSCVTYQYFILPSLQSITVNVSPEYDFVFSLISSVTSCGTQWDGSTIGSMSTGTVAVAGGGAMPISAKEGMIADMMFPERKNLDSEVTVYAKY
jgi:hypothetical protein